MSVESLSPAASALLRRLPLLGALPPELSADVARQFRSRSMHRGEVLWRAGERGDELLVILAGSVQVLAAGAREGELVAELGVGDCLGEMSLITGEPRSASAVVAATGAVAALGREEFEVLLARHPMLAVALSRTISHRLRTFLLGERGRKRPRRIAAVSHGHDRATARLLGHVVIAISEVTREPVTIIHGAGGETALELQSLSDTYGSIAVRAATSGWQESARSELCVSWIHPACADAMATARAADTVIVLEPNGAQPVAREWMETVVGHTDLILLRAACDAIGDGSVFKVDATACEETPGHSRHAAAFRRAARAVLRRRVGVALSAGNARGFSHIGVLLALERAGIEVDLIAGTSMGAVIGGLYATGRGAESLISETQRLVRQLRAMLREISLTGVSLLRGERKRELLQGQAGTLLIEHLPIPFRAIAADLARAREVVLDHGPLWQAMDASSAIPAIFPPVVVGDQALVDGWVVNPLPVDVLKREGAALVIGVDVSGSTRPASATESPVELRAFVRGGTMRRQLGMIRVAMRALDTGAQERTLASLALADVVVAPDVERFPPTDYGRVTELTECGEAAGVVAAAAVREALARL